jgi:hypothetical protein
LDPFVDFVGVPREEKDKSGKTFLDFVLPKHFVLGKIKAIFIDEYNRSHKKVRNATMELVQFKSINGRKFPELKAVWVGINPFTEDELDQSYDVEELDPAQLDRFQIQIKLPYQADLNYFKSKFDAETAKSAVEWWNSVPNMVKYKVSPRRLDYALDIHKMGGDVFDVLPLESNPSKLVTLLTIGNIEDKLKSIFENSDYEDAKKLLNSENNYQSAIPFMLKNKEYKRFFLPVLSEERLTSLFFKEDSVKDYVLKNPLYFKSTLSDILSADSCDKGLKPYIQKALKSVDSFDLVNEG